MNKEDYLKFHKQYDELNAKVIEVLTRRNDLKIEYNQFVDITPEDYPDITFYEDEVALCTGYPDYDYECIPISFLTDPDTAFAEFEKEMEDLYQSKLKVK